ncbi:MAG: 5-(carboxyamino)imidazole ribonucleotide synthase [Gammaproteobacteria bacterium]|nr:5-(carboxyamino)imidazole ribonucleotide synthase [Gammaproteobacteria bacterium]
MKRARVGIVGAGQLGRMLALAGYPLGIECILLDRSGDSPGGQVAQLRLGALDDAEALAALAKDVDAVTLEIENVPVEALEAAARFAPVRPGAAAVAAAQDRLAEKRLFSELGIATAPFVEVGERAALRHAAAQLEWPIVLKARRMGYDGRGQRVARSADELERAFTDLGEVPCIAEQWVRFERELSLIAVQGADRERVYYPLAENEHESGILAATTAPYDDPHLWDTAKRALDALLDRLDYRGVLTVEFFHAGGTLVANEMAPRVHNSGHWTIEGAETSQFENHLRAVLGWPLGDASPRGVAGMVNLLGRMPPRERLLSIPGVHLHDYGKAPRPGRKLGHLTIVDTSREQLLERLRLLRSEVGAAET